MLNKYKLIRVSNIHSFNQTTAQRCQDNIVLGNPRYLILLHRYLSASFSSDGVKTAPNCSSHGCRPGHEVDSVHLGNLVEPQYRWLKWRLDQRYVSQITFGFKNRNKSDSFAVVVHFHGVRKDDIQKGSGRHPFFFFSGQHSTP